MNYKSDKQKYYGTWESCDNLYHLIDLQEEMVKEKISQNKLEESAQKARDLFPEEIFS